jgi:pyrimidine operon attenuation protein/uracil phosphoribosyltransferase
MITNMSPTNSVTLRDKIQLMSASEIERTLVRLAHEIVEKNNGVQNLALVGIRRRGIPIAQRIAAVLERIEKVPVPVATIDISFYRDDLSTVGAKPQVSPKALECDIVGKDVVLVDDVLYTGRTIRAALDALFDCGRARKVQLLVLIDRGHRELPIEATFVGRRIQTTQNEVIEVKLEETDQVEKVMLVERVSAERA